jgi:predicted transcriptional regulator
LTFDPKALKELFVSKKAFRIRVEDELYDEVTHVAEIDGATPTQVIRTAVWAYVEHRKAEQHARAVFKNP